MPRTREDDLKDARGIEITVGALCVYNLSGSIATGVIESIHAGWNKMYPSYSWEYWTGHFKIRQCDETGKLNHVSKVKNGSSIMILKAFPWE
jgi:hypothetical protein